MASWLRSRVGGDDWGNAREMRTVLERAREAQALRLSSDDNPDLNLLTKMDLERAMGRRVAATAGGNDG